MTDSLRQMREAIEDKLRRVNTTIPGRVESYDAATRQAEVQPLITEKYADGQTRDLPKISNVPVVMPSSASAGLSLPIGSGDIVLLAFAQRSIDRWLTLGGKVDAADIRMHDLSDAIAIAGLFPFSESHDDGSGLLLYNDAIKIRLDGGKVAIGTSLVELLDELTKALDEIVTLAPTWGAATVQVQLSSAAIKTIMGTL